MHRISEVKTLTFPIHGDERGHMVVIEENMDIPFEIKRVFYIFGSDRNVIRGQHANVYSQFVLVNVAGTSKVRVRDGRGEEKVYCLEQPYTGIYLPSMIWKEMYDFSNDSVLLCLSNEHYNSKEYIRDYDEFLKIVKK